MRISLLFYNLFLWLYAAGAGILSFFSPKAKLWVNGRKNIFKNLQTAFEANTAPVAWFHCASLGEFEQGRPLIEKLKKEYPQYKVLVTFFSPSGYEIRKNYALADWVFYLPHDGKMRAQKFVEITKPSVAFFIKYEFWYYYLSAIHKKNIPLFLISGLFRPSQPFFKWYGGWQREALAFFTHFFVQNQASSALLKNAGITNVSIAGDTRFDRVIATKNNWTEVEGISAFCNDKKVFVAGSTWEEDDLIMRHFVAAHPEMRFIMAPHQVEEKRIKQCMEIYGNAVPYSAYLQSGGVSEKINTLIIDNIGMLSRLYKYADIAFVGGAFSKNGIHNVLEPLVFGKPIIYGPEFEKFPEAVALADLEIGFPVYNALEFDAAMNELINNPSILEKVKAASEKFVAENQGATEKIFLFVRRYL